jgi:hypothetical protein
MKFYGHANFQNVNQIQQASLQIETAFPASPSIGRIAFINKVVYICADIIDNIPLWIPLTNEISTFIHIQDVAANTWTINHTLNTPFVMVQVFDGNNQMFIPNQITINGSSQVIVSNGSPAAGRAIVVSGSLDGSTRPTYALEYTQTSPAAVWTIIHNLGYNPIVRVFIGSSEVQPASIVHTNTNTVVITFLDVQVGYVKLI